MQKYELCFKDFPDQCKGCPEYRERRPDSTLARVLSSGIGMTYPRQYTDVVIKECNLYHKRKVETLE